MLAILQLIILLTSAVYGFVPHGDIGTSAAAKAAMFPLQQQNGRPNDIAVYDPGVGEYCTVNTIYSHLIRKTWATFVVFLSLGL